MTDASVPNVFKFFSPLRSPGSATESQSAKTKKNKRKHECQDECENSGKNNLTRDKDITGDILKLASGITKKLSEKKFENLDSDTGSIDFNISPRRARLLNARIAGCPIENKSTSTVFCKNSVVQSQNNDFKLLTPVNKQFSLQMKENINSKEMIRKIHELSPSPKKSKSESSKRKKKSSDKDNNQLHEESGKQNTRKSVTIATNGAQDSENSGSEEDSVISDSDSSVASRDVKDSVTSERDNKSDDESLGSEEDSVASGSDNDSVASNNDSVASQNDSMASGGDDDEIQETSVTQTPRKTRYKIKPGFSEVVEKEGKALYVCEDDLRDKDMWLIKAPYDINLESLTNQEIHVDEMSSVSIKETNEAYDILPHKDTSGLVSTFCPVLPSKKPWKYRPGCRFVGQIQINKSLELPALPSFERAAPKRVEIPSGLKQRFQPFGAKPPQCTDSSSVKKHKKSKKRKHDDSIHECTEPSKKRKKLKKSKNHDNAEEEIKHKKKKKKKHKS